MEKRHNFKQLRIWLQGMKIANLSYQTSKGFPRSERYDLTSQFKRAAISIPSNIAEGSSRTDKSFINYLEISLGSSFELETQLIIARDQVYISENDFKNLECEINIFQKMTRTFIRRLKNGMN